MMSGRSSTGRAAVSKTADRGSSPRVHAIIQAIKVGTFVAALIVVIIGFGLEHTTSMLWTQIVFFVLTIAGNAFLIWRKFR